MNKRQETAFWDAMRSLDELELLKHIMIIGSWAEYLYPALFETDFRPNIRTRDIDLFYRNIHLPKEKIPLIAKLKESGFVYEEDPYSHIAKFYKEDLLELEFLTRVLGSGGRNTYSLEALGIKAEGLRDINILADYACEIVKEGYTLIIPEPAAYVVQKLLVNSKRRPTWKREKDIRAVEELLIHIKQNDYHQQKLINIYNTLTKKQQKILKKVANENFIDIFG